MDMDAYNKALKYWSKQPDWAIDYEIKHCYMLLKVKYWLPNKGLVKVKKERVKVKARLAALKSLNKTGGKMFHFFLFLAHMWEVIKENRWALFKVFFFASLVYIWYAFLIAFSR